MTVYASSRWTYPKHSTECPIILCQIKQTNPGVNTHIVNWLKGLLSDRVQIVSFQNELSKPASINQGVPQGRVLGPPSFNMSFDDLKCLNENACLVKFADDNNPVFGVKGLDDPSRIIIEVIFKWCMDHNFITTPLNPQK